MDSMRISLILVCNLFATVIQRYENTDMEMKPAYIDNAFVVTAGR